MRLTLIGSEVWRRTLLRLKGRVTAAFFVGFAAGIGILVLSAVAFWAAERGVNEQVRGLGSGFKWVTVTLLTQSTPWDIETGIGDFLYYLVLIVGVGLVALGTGAIASKLVEYIIQRGSGMGRAKVKGHILICGWSSQGSEILRELHAEEVQDKRPVVILADLQSTPTRDELTTFIRGNPANAEDLERAGINDADTAIILSDRTNRTATDDDRDAKTLLTALAVESLNEDCYTCVEVIRSENRVHFERAKADEIVVSAEMTGALLASSAVTHGLSRVVADLITHPEGHEFYAVELPLDLEGKRFEEVIREMKSRHDCVVIAVSSYGGRYQLNPPGELTLNRADRLLVVASDVTALPAARGDVAPPTDAEM